MNYYSIIFIHITQNGLASGVYVHFEIGKGGERGRRPKPLLPYRKHFWPLAIKLSQFNLHKPQSLGVNHF